MILSAKACKLNRGYDPTPSWSVADRNLTRGGILIASTKADWKSEYYSYLGKSGKGGSILLQAIMEPPSLITMLLAAS